MTKEMPTEEQEALRRRVRAMSSREQDAALLLSLGVQALLIALVVFAVVAALAWAFT